MSVAARALRLLKRHEEDAAWRLLRADNAPIIAAVLGEYLTDEESRVDADDLYERVDADLEDLRSRGIDLPLTARAYVAQWRNAGYLVRRATEAARGETLELSSAGIAAIRFLDQRDAPRRTLTESRLATLTQQVRQLAVDTDPQSARRLARLKEERDRLDERIAAIESGQDQALEGDRALERVHDLLAQAAEVPDDFARVRAEFEHLNDTLRARILDDDARQREVLDDVFRGVDLIAESDAGRSFQGFSRLVVDPATGAAFDDDVRDLLDRDFAGRLTSAERRQLRDFLPVLKDRSADIQTVITQFARGLRRYVRSQDFLTDRLLRDEIRTTMQSARTASAHIRPFHEVGIDLDLSSVSIRSIGALTLHDPAELDASGALETHDEEVADLEALRALARATEIDFDELRDNVNAVIATQREPTLADVLAAHPATQGVASIVGLLALVASHGIDQPEHTDILTWEGADGAARQARVARSRFTERIP